MDEANELLNRIQEILTEGYEPGHNYSKLEIKEVLDEIVEAMESRS